MAWRVDEGRHLRLVQRVELAHLDDVEVAVAVGVRPKLAHVAAPLDVRDAIRVHGPRAHRQRRDDSVVVPRDGEGGVHDDDVAAAVVREHVGLGVGRVAARLHVHGVAPHDGRLRHRHRRHDVLG